MTKWKSPFRWLSLPLVSGTLRVKVQPMTTSEGGRPLGLVATSTTAAPVRIAWIHENLARRHRGSGNTNEVRERLHKLQSRRIMLMERPGLGRSIMCVVSLVILGAMILPLKR